MKTALAAVTGIALGLYVSSVWLAARPEHPHEVLLLAAGIGLVTLLGVACWNWKHRNRN